MSKPTRASAAGRAYLDLQNLARRQHRSTQELLVLYVLERFLARLAASEHREKFVLKGGMLLAALNARRPTVDADLLATHLSNDTHEVLARVIEIAGTPMDPDDGVTYLTDTAKARIIREGDLYSGVRVTMNATVAAADVKLQLDINFGDPITPAPSTITYPGLRADFAPVQILGYPLATVLAEKLTTAIQLGAANTRIRDYADIWTLTGLHDLDTIQLQAALENTATHRKITLRPLSAALGDLATVRARTYETYRRRLGQDSADLPEKFLTLVDDVTAFADPLILHTSGAHHWQAHSRTWTS
jgi:Nucleotidyl transferase AbiEii toxin, Type IV TA system